jgi:hypothetical protein
VIERRKNLPSGIDGLAARGKVRREDFHNVVQPLLEEARREGRRIRLLYQFGPDFEGFTPGAAWEDARIGLHYLRLFERCAIVTDIGWVRESARLVASFLPCPMGVFGNSELKNALSWVGAPNENEALSYRLLATFGVLILEPRGPLRAEDFEALALVVDPWIEAHGPLQGIVVHAKTFPGWESFGGFLRHLRFVRDHHRKVRRIAMAVDGALAELAPRLAEHFIQAEVKHFKYDEYKNALEWAKAEGPQPS